eukprot:1340618-Amphidinium_carterae.1
MEVVEVELWFRISVATLFTEAIATDAKWLATISPSRPLNDIIQLPSMDKTLKCVHFQRDL